MRERKSLVRQEKKLCNLDDIILKPF